MGADEDGPIQVTVVNRVVCVPAAVLFDTALSERARLFQALWYLLEDCPTYDEVAQYLGYDRAAADELLEELARHEDELDERER